jgi:hypothetical protein
MHGIYNHYLIPKKGVLRGLTQKISASNLKLNQLTMAYSPRNSKHDLLFIQTTLWNSLMDSARNEKRIPS